MTCPVMLADATPCLLDHGDDASPRLHMGAMPYDGQYAYIYLHLVSRQRYDAELAELRGEQ